MAKKILRITESQYKRLQEKKIHEITLLNEFTSSISNTKKLLFEDVVNKNYVKEAISKSILTLTEKNVSANIFESAVQIMLEEGISQQMISEGIGQTFKTLLMRGTAYATIAKMMGTMLLPLFLMFSGGNVNAQSRQEFQKLPPEKKVEVLAQKVNHSGGGDGDDHKDDGHLKTGHHGPADLEAKVKAGTMVKGFADVVDSHGKTLKQPVYAHNAHELQDRIDHIKQLNADDIKSNYSKSTERGQSQGTNGQTFNDKVRDTANQMDVLNKLKSK